MGSGKSTVGELLSRELRWPFIDLDTVIEAGQGVTIREIFERSGEPFFRQLERAALTEVLKSEPAVIALGGGTFAYEANVELIRETGGTTIWLDCPLETVRQRVEQASHRPLARDGHRFEELFHARQAAYAKADYRIPIECDDPSAALEAILQLPLFG